MVRKNPIICLTKIILREIVFQSAITADQTHIQNHLEVAGFTNPDLLQILGAMDQEEANWKGQI